jgi:hypothetical protein
MTRVYVSGIINLPVEKVWAYARDFNGHHDWHPIIAESHIEGGKPSDQVGAIRNFKLADGGHLRESLLSFSELDRSFTYDIIVSPLPVKNYIATFTCKPVTEGNKTFVEWTANFDTLPENEADLQERVGRNTFAAGIAALAKKLGAPA